MKKILLLLVVISSQLHAQIPNAGFETWVNSTGSPHTYQVPQSWTSLDPLFNLINASYTVASVVQTTQSHSGTKAALLQTAIGGGDTVGGVLISTASIATFFGSGMPGFACSTRPANFQAYYKFTPVGGDMAAFGVWLTKWNTGTNTRDTIASGTFITPAAAASYVQATAPLSYSLNLFPDTAMIEAILVGGSSSTHVGSQFFVDDLSFSGSTPFAIEGFSQAEMFQMHPNPANGSLHLESEREIGSVQILNGLGEQVLLDNVKNTSTTIDVSMLPPGVYTVRMHGITRKLIKQ